MIIERRTAVLAILSAFLLAPIAAAGADQPPGIVLILADDLGYGHLGAYGQEKIATPNLDRLAAEGMRFTQAYAGSHVCQPSRSVLMTGLHTGHTPVRANDVNQLLLPHDVTVAELLQDAGYATGAFGKWGLGYEGTTGHPNRQGFDEFFGQLLQVHAHFYYPYWVWHNEKRRPLPGNEDGGRKQYVQDEMHARALDFIRRHHEKPFFAYLPYIIPHVELVVPEESERPYRGKFPKRAILDTRPGYIGAEDGYATVAGMISRLDAQVGEVMALLEELGVADNTLVIFSSDNGAQSGGKDAGWTAMTDFFRGNGDLRGYKGQFYEGGIRVPLIVRWPGRVEPGSTSDHVCAFWDILPTLAEVAGARPPENIDGLSLVPTLTGSGEQPEHEYLYWEYARGGGLTRAIRRGPWKAIQNRPGGEVELYNLKHDPSETTDVSAKHPDRVERLIQQMNDAHRPPHDYPPTGPRTGIADYVR
ncbi:MAG: arylsulfatase [Planctomycetes bacterium]|nr:arylsulfatase [Planctomycetota bacterium]